MAAPLHLAFILCGPKLSLSARELNESWKLFGDYTVRFDAVVEKGALSITIGEHRATVTAAARKFAPPREPEEAAQFSVSKFWDYKLAAPHATHLEVAFWRGPTESPLKALECFCDLVATVMSSVDAVGVYLGGAGATHSDEFVDEVYAERTQKAALWCGVSYAIVKEQPGFVSYLSLGMRQLGLREIELRISADESEEGLSRLFDIAIYVAKLGRNLEDGETVGPEGSDEKHPVRIVASPTRPNQTVCLVVVE